MVKRGGSCYRSPHNLWISRRRATGGAWRRRAATAPAVPEDLLSNSWIFRGLFCNFYMLEYVFKLLFVFCLIFVIL